MKSALAAPGKVFLAGEYAVLERGQPALVIAIDRALHLDWRPLPGGQLELRHQASGATIDGALTGDPRAPLRLGSGVPGELRFALRGTALALRLGAEEGLEPRGYAAAFLDDLALDVAGAGAAGAKLGLGGSAAASVLAVRAACAAQGRALLPKEALALAVAAHWAEQGGTGSGADVAACALGGALEVRVLHGWRSPEEPLAGAARALLEQPPLEVRPLALPGDLRVLLAWSGAPADTRALVREVRLFASAQPSRWQHHVQAISGASAALRDALAAADACGSPSPERAAGSAEQARGEALDAIRRAAAAMAALGAEAACPIVTDELARICAIASAAGGAGKPSGAGGGDCAVVLCFGDDVLARCRGALETAGVPTFAVSVAPEVAVTPEAQ